MSSPMLILLSICILIQGTLADNFTDTVVGGERVKRSLDKCITCICNVESGGCRAIGCNMDEGSLSCGYFQIKNEYYIDCYRHGMRSGESLENAWKRCSDDYNCALGCMKAYIQRYKGQCPGRGECETMSKLHNGGPRGCNLDRTISYWAKVQACLAN